MIHLLLLVVNRINLLKLKHLKYVHNSLMVNKNNKLIELKTNFFNRLFDIDIK